MQRNIESAGGVRWGVGGAAGTPVATRLVATVWLCAAVVGFFDGRDARGDQPPTAIAAPVQAAVPAAAPAAELKPGPNDRVIAKTVRMNLEEGHFLRRRVDDEISRRWFKAFLEALDPMKIYFLQGDVDALGMQQDSLDDMVRKGDVAFAYQAYAKLLQRIDARLPRAEKLLDEPHDFTKPESFMVDRKTAGWPRTEAEADDLWRRRIKYDLLVQKMLKTPDAEAKDKLRRRYSSYAKRMHQMTADELLEMNLSTLTSSLDPHTTYMSPSSVENFAIQMRLELEGIGAQLKGEDGYTTIMALTPGGAADKDGRLKPNDRIVGVGEGRDGEILDIVDMNLNEVVKKIRGKRGTVVRLKVVSDGETDPKIYDITREKIELSESAARGEVIEHGKKADGSPYRIGVVNLPSFYMDMDGHRQGNADYRSSTRDTKKLLDEFREKGVDAVVLDLRSNGGGSLSEAIDLTGMFIDRGPVVQIKDADKQIRAYDDTRPGVSWEGPLVVLTSKFSASASEILAGAIQDYRRGLVIGDEATHGKGTVQSLLDLSPQLFRGLDNRPPLGAIKITMQQFYRPSGASTQLEGVKSDVVLPSLTSHLPVGEADLDHAIPFDKVPAAAFKSVDRTSDAVVQQLRQRSTERVNANEEFVKLAKDIARYQKRKDEKTVSLVEGDFEKQWNEGKAADDEQEKKLEELEAQKRPVVRRDFYFDEAMNIVIDYLQLLGGAGAVAAAPQSAGVVRPATEPAPRAALPAIP